MEKLAEVTEEQKKYSIDALVTLVVEQLSEELDMDAKDVLRDFVASKTGALLYDESSKLWWNGPSYIADIYKEEQRKILNEKGERLAEALMEKMTPLILEREKKTV